MRQSSIIGLAARVTLLALVGGCFTTHRLPLGSVSHDGELHVRFASPRELWFAQPSVPAALLPGVRSLTGRLLTTSGDSVQVQARSARDTTGRELLTPATGTVWFVREAADVLEVHQFSGDRTILLGLAAIAVLAVTYVVVLAVALSRAEW